MIKVRAISVNPTGFICIQKSPLWDKPIGYFEPYTTGEFMGHPKYWKPLYEIIKDEEHIKYSDDISHTESFYMVFVENGNSPTQKHTDYESAKKEAERLCDKTRMKTFILKAVTKKELRMIETTHLE